MIPRAITLSERACEMQRKWRTAQLRAEVLAMQIPPEDEQAFDEFAQSFVEGRARSIMHQALGRG